MEHECAKNFKTRKIDGRSGEGYNKCSGINPMILEVWYPDKGGLEEYFENCMFYRVNFCPFCGMKAQEII